MRPGPHPFTLRQLQYAAAVAETRHFRRAAELCRVSQPALSAQLAELEAALGVKLFERDRRHVLVTHAGERLLERARRLLVEADDLAEAAQRLRDPLAGTLRLGVIPTISPYLLPRIVPVLRRRLARLTVLWTEDKTDVLVEALRAGTIEGALLALEADVGDVESEVVARDRFLLATPRRHPLASSKRPVRDEELEGLPFLLLDDGHCFRQQALAVCTSAHARELDFRATSLSTLAQMVAAGSGVTLLPELAAPTETRRSPLALRPLAAPNAFRTVALVWRRSTAVVEALRAVAAAIREAYPASAPPVRRRV